MVMSRSSAAAFALCAFAGVATPLLAQQRGNFSSSVAASAQEVFIAEPQNEYAPGAVYVYQPAAGKWRRAAVLSAGDGTNFDRFGSAVAVDGTTLLVGAANADSGRGAAYVFTRGAGGWKQSAKLTVPGVKANEGVGVSVAIHGDLALIASAGDSAAGSVFVFRRSGSGWTPDGRAAAVDADEHDDYGSSVAIAGDRVFVGAPRQDSLTGAVYVFHKDKDGAWTADPKLRARGLEKRGRFGSVIVPSSTNEVLVGAPGLAGGAGSVVVLQADTISHMWRETGRLMPFDGGPAAFGNAIAVDGNTVWVGAPAVNRAQGRVYQITRDSTGAGIASVKLSPAAAASGRLGFGGSIALAGGHGVIGQIADAFGEGSAIPLTRSARGWTMGDKLEGEPRGLTASTGSRVDCTNNSARIFGCNDMDLVSFLPTHDLGGARGVILNDLWGWTDPASGREYALVGRVDGTSFVDVSDASHPRYLGNLPKTAKANPAVWRDIKVYQHYAYIVSDGSGDHGVQIFDLNKLKTVRGAPVTFTEDAHYDKVHSVHNIVIDTTTGFAYAVGSSSGGETCGGGLHMIDIREPLQPKFAGCFADPATGRAGTGYIHDAQCVVYHGPDQAMQTHEICFNAAETALSVADVTDKDHPVALAHVSYPNVGYAHQGWLTADQKYFYMDDELDELQGKVDGTRTLIWDVSKLSDPVLAGQYISKDKSSDHNLYIVGNTVYESNYQSGLRVLDISDRLNPKEVAYFDTVPVGVDAPGFGGSWSNYPFFKSGTIVVTSGKEGLFMLKRHQAPLTP